MKMYKIVCIFLLLVCGCHTFNETAIGERTKKAFSIFSVVNFPNYQCTTLSTANTKTVMYGTCQPLSTCNSNGGTPDGNCASGFGVCCMFSSQKCPETITQNLTYISNPGFPSTFTLPTCTVTFQSDASICQIRLDFDNFVTLAPNTAGSCVSDKFVTTSMSGYAPPTICGTNTGRHMYIETGKVAGNSATMTFTFDTTAANPTRTWKIRVSYIECVSNYRAPRDCVQYFTGQSGTFQSYNFLAPGGQVLEKQNYNYCFRQEEGYCSMDISTTGTDTFQLSVVNAAGPFIVKRAPASCLAIRIMVRSNVITPAKTPAAATSTEYHCGTKLGNLAGDVVSGIVNTNALPFMVGFYSNTLTQSTNLIGFSLQYNQLAC